MHGKLLSISMILLAGVSCFDVGCSSFDRRSEQAQTQPATANTNATEGADKNLPANEKAVPAASTEGVVTGPELKSNVLAMKKGQVATKEQAKIKLVGKNGKAVDAPAEATSKSGKEMTKVQLPHERQQQEAEENAKETLASAGTATAEHAAGVQTAPLDARHAGPVSADKALGWLKNGNTRFVKGTTRNDGASRKDRARLVAGQQPHAVVLSCSDSRVPPEIVFDQKLGEIFVVRVAGEALDASSIGSVEYAVEHLGANLVIVMGHESCGAVKAAIGTLDGSGLGSPALNGMIADLRPRLQQFKNTTPSKGYLDESWANVDGVAHDLIERSEIVRDAVTSGEVKVARGVYHLDSGQVEWK